MKKEDLELLINSTPNHIKILADLYPSSFTIPQCKRDVAKNLGVRLEGAEPPPKLRLVK